MIEDGQKTDEIVCLEGEKEATVEAEEAAGSVINEDVGFEQPDDNGFVKGTTVYVVGSYEPAIDIVNFKDPKQTAGWARHQVYIKTDKAMDHYLHLLRKTVKEKKILDDINLKRLEIAVVDIRLIFAHVLPEKQILRSIASYYYDAMLPTKELAKGLKRLLMDGHLINV
jgi:hypothetical protein